MELYITVNHFVSLIESIVIDCMAKMFLLTFELYYLPCVFLY